MDSFGNIFRKTQNYRVLIDSEGVGHIRIIKRVNFRTILVVFKDLYLELKKNEVYSPHIIIYVSQSLCDEMSENMHGFLDFAVSCMDGTFEIRVIE